MGKLMKFPTLEELHEEFDSKARYKDFNSLSVYFIESSKFPLPHRLTALDTDTLFQSYVKKSLKEISDRNLKLCDEKSDATDSIQFEIFSESENYIDYEPVVKKYLK